MNRILFYLLLVFFSFKSQAQIPDMAWAKGLYSKTYEGKMCLDASGNMYVVGTYYGSVDFDMGPGSAMLTAVGSWDIYVMKLDASGNFLWVKGIGGADEDRGIAIACDAYANIYFTGFFMGSNVDFNPGTGSYTMSANDQDIFVCKLDSSGSFKWSKGMGGSDWDMGYAIAVDKFGSVYTTGQYYGNVDFDPGPGVFNLAAFNSSSYQEVFVQKLNSNGVFQWAKRIASQKTDIGRSITTDLSGNVYIAGSYESTADFDPGSGTNVPNFYGGGDAFLLKLTSSGDFIWVRTWGGAGYEACSTVVADASGNVYTTGHFQQSVDFNTGSDTLLVSSNGNRDIFIHKLDSGGNFLWVECLGAQNNDAGTDLLVDPNGDVYATGYFRNNAYFNPRQGSNQLVSNGGSDLFVMKLDSSSNFKWAFNIGGSGADDASSIVTNGNGDTYVLGSYVGTVDFDPDTGVLNLTAIGTTSNMYIFQLDECVTNYATHYRSTCSTYTWVDSITYSTNTTTPKDTLINHKGCDSIVTLNLTILPTTYGTRTVTACDSFTWDNGITYYASNNTAVDTFVNVDGCNHIVTLDLTILNSTASTDSVQACISYTWIDGKTYTASTSNTVRDTLVNAAGCDSVVTLELVILQATYSIDSVTACDSFTWINGITYKNSSSNLVKDTLVNAAGCDSIVTLNLIILRSNSSQDVVSSCDSFKWIDGITYTTNNSSAKYTLSNASGCDSNVYLQLTVNPSYAMIDSIHACREYTWINGIRYTANTSGVYQTLTSNAGCDSTIELKLMIHDVDTATSIVGGVSIQANQAGANYQWLDVDKSYSIIPGAKQQSYSPTIKGNYAVEINTGYCLDTSSSVFFIGTGLENSLFAQGIHLYPNPTRSNVSLTVDATYSQLNIRVFDATGKLVGQYEWKDKAIGEIVLPSTAGVYFVEITTEQERAVFKVSKY